MDERFFASLIALNGESDNIYPDSMLSYEDWGRVTYGGHPHDFEADEVNTELLMIARTDRDCEGTFPTANTSKVRQPCTTMLWIIDDELALL